MGGHTVGNLPVSGQMGAGVPGDGPDLQCCCQCCFFCTVAIPFDSLLETDDDALSEFIPCYFLERMVIWRNRSDGAELVEFVFASANHASSG